MKNSMGPYFVVSVILFNFLMMGLSVSTRDPSSGFLAMAANLGLLVNLWADSQ